MTASPASSSRAASARPRSGDRGQSLRRHRRRLRRHRRRRAVPGQGVSLFAARSARRSALVEAHRDGRYITLRLTSSMYHRFHAPYDCRIEQVSYITGDTWNVNPIALKRVERLFCKNERAVIRTRLAGGEVLTLVPVAAILVASIRLRFLDVLLNAATPRADGVPLRRPACARARKWAGSSTARPSSCWRPMISSSATMSVERRRIIAGQPLMRKQI